MSRATETFSGDLGLLSLFDLGQLLVLNRATGCLSIVHGERKGYLYFLEGRLVNAVDDAYTEGEPAAHRVFRWREGHFEFRAESPGGTGTIETSTDALMLEAARQIDEEALAEGAPRADGTETGKLTERRQALEALRDEFHRVTGEARLAAPPAGGSPGVHLFELIRPGEALLYRPGHPPRIRRRGAWAAIDPTPLSTVDYGELRSRLLDACVPGPVVSGDLAARFIELADGRTIELEFVNQGPEEAMWLVPVQFAAPAAAGLDGSFEALDELLETSPGVIIAGAHDLHSARWLMHALVAMLAQRGSTVVVASSDLTYRHAEDVVLRSLPRSLGATLRVVDADVVALDPALRAGDIDVADLEAVPRVLTGAVGTEPRSLVSRWLARLAHGQNGFPRSWLASLPIGLVIARLTEEGESTLHFTATRLSDEDRAATLQSRLELVSPGPRKHAG